MPVVLRTQGFTFSFYANDHDPPHVHACHAGTWCRITISTLDIEDLGMKPRDQIRAAALVHQHRGQLLTAWATFQARKRGKDG